MSHPIPFRGLAGGCLYILLISVIFSLGGCPPGSVLTPSAGSTSPPVLRDLSASGVLRVRQVGRVTVSAVVVDGDNDVTGVTVDLGEVGGPAEDRMTVGKDGVWTWSGSVLPLVAGSRTVRLTARDAGGHTATATTSVEVRNPPEIPTIAKVTVEGDLEAGLETVVTVTVTAIDADGTVRSVVADLSDIGGDGSQALEASSNGTWTFTGPVRPAKAGSRNIVITATDNDDGSNQTTVHVTVRTANKPPQVANLSIEGSLTVGRPGTISLSVEATDSHGTVAAVTADLSAIGGAGEQPLEKGDNNQWSLVETLTPPQAGTWDIVVTAVDDRGAAASRKGTVTVDEPLAIDLDIEGVAEDQEDTVGGAVAINADDDNGNGTADMDEAGPVKGENDLLAVRISVTGGSSEAKVRLAFTAGAEKARLWTTAARTQELVLPHEWDRASQEVPAEVYLEGLVPSEGLADVELMLTTDDLGGNLAPEELSDSVRVTIVSGRKIPLGFSETLAGPVVSKVYIPTRQGGTLTLAGGDVELIYTDGSDLEPYVAAQVLAGRMAGSVVAQGDPCIYRVPAGRSGWYYVRYRGEVPAEVSSRFVEEGEAAKKPWVGWWWPRHPDVNPNNYDDGGPFQKYDQVYGTSAQDWERTYTASTVDWWGHCWGWSNASILLDQPKATTKNGVFFSEDDMEALYTELADSSIGYDEALTVLYIPPGPPTGAAGEEVDKYCDDLYRIISVTIGQERTAVQSDMRAVATPPDRAEEVWNHGIYRYVAWFREAPGTGDERLVEVTVGVWATSPARPPSIAALDRYEEYVCQLEFDAQGNVVTDSAQQNWLSASHYPPHDLVKLTGIVWQGANPYITRANVDALYEP